MPYPHWNAFHLHISYAQPTRLTPRKASLTVASSTWHEGNTALWVVLWCQSDPLLSEQWHLSSNLIPSTLCRHRCSSNPCMWLLTFQAKLKVSPQAHCPSGKLTAKAHHEVWQLQSRRAAAGALTQRSGEETALLHAVPRHDECGTAPSRFLSKKVSGQSEFQHSPLHFRLLC